MERSTYSATLILFTRNGFFFVRPCHYVKMHPQLAYERVTFQIHSVAADLLTKLWLMVDVEWLISWERVTECFIGCRQLDLVNTVKETSCFVDRTSWYIRITWTNKMHYFLLIYFNSKPLCVSSRLAAHHQEDRLCINRNCWLAAGRIEIELHLDPASSQST